MTLILGRREYQTVAEKMASPVELLRSQSHFILVDEEPWFMAFSKVRAKAQAVF